MYCCPEVVLRNVKLLVNGLAAVPGGSLSYLLRFLEAAARDEVLPADTTVLASSSNANLIRKAWPGHLLVCPDLPAPARIVYEQLVVPLRFRRHWLLSPFNFSPIIFGRHRSTVVLHNSNYFGDGIAFNAGASSRKRAERWLAHTSVRRSRFAVAISESLAYQVRKTRGLEVSELIVVHSGAPEMREPQRPKHSNTHTGFHLSLANGYPHKNLSSISAAWSAADCKRDLVFVGGHISDAQQKEISDHGRSNPNADIHLVGQVTDPDEVAWYIQNCHSLISSSSLEAHPLTPAEAALYGKHLVLSDIAPHREICGERAHYFSPTDVAALSRILLEIEFADQPEPWSWSTSWTDTARGIALTLEV